MKSRFIKKTKEWGNDVNVGAGWTRKLFATKEMTKEITRLTKDAKRNKSWCLRSDE